MMIMRCRLLLLSAIQHPCYQTKLHWEQQVLVIIDSVDAPELASPRDRTRAQLVEVAAQLLAGGGPDAVTTRSVALAAGVQAPAIYRLFGDKSGLLDAVAEHGFAGYLARKPPVDADGDPVESLRAGWQLHIGFGLANPELFRLMHTARPTPGRPRRRRGRARGAAGPRTPSRRGGPAAA